MSVAIIIIIIIMMTTNANTTSLARDIHPPVIFYLSTPILAFIAHHNV